MSAVTNDDVIQQPNYVPRVQKVGVLILGVLIVHGEGLIDGPDGLEADRLLLTFPLDLSVSFMG